MVKRISVLVRGRGNPKLKDIEIGKGTTGKAVKAKLGTHEGDREKYREFNIFRRDTSEILDDSIDLHRVLKEGEKLEFSIPAELGAE